MALQAIDGLDRLDAGDCERLRQRLRDAGYDGPFMGEVESVAPLNLDRPRRPLIRWFLDRRGGPAADVARLFCYFETVARDAAESALGAELVARLLEAGLLSPAGGSAGSGA